MTCRRIHLVTVSAALAALLTAGLAIQPARAVPQKATVVAVIDVQKAFDGLDEKSEIEAYRERQLRRIQEEYNTRKEEIDKLTAELDVLEQDSPLRQQKEDEVIMKTAQLDAWMRLEERRHSREVANRLEKVRRSMMDTIEAVAKAQTPRIDLVLNRETTINLPTGQRGTTSSINIRKVLYASAELDITDNVIQRMNNEFRNRGGRTSGG